MRMTKPSARDIDAAGELMGILQIIDKRFGGPWPTEGPESLDALLHPSEDEWLDFDEDNPTHLQALYNSLAKLLRTAGGFPGRVIGGMCYVICWDQNEILDPADDCIELHPNLRKGLELLQEYRKNFIPNLVQQAQAAVAATIEESAARHLAEMALRAKQPNGEA